MRSPFWSPVGWQSLPLPPPQTHRVSGPPFLGDPASPGWPPAEGSLGEGLLDDEAPLLLQSFLLLLLPHYAALGEVAVILAPWSPSPMAAPQAPGTEFPSVLAELLRQPQGGEPRKAWPWFPREGIPPRTPPCPSLPTTHASWPLASKDGQHHRAPCESPNVAMANDHKRSGLDSTNLFSYSSGGLGSEMGFTGLQSRCGQGRIPSGSSGENPLLAISGIDKLSAFLGSRVALFHLQSRHHITLPSARRCVSFSDSPVSLFPFELLWSHGPTLLISRSSAWSPWQGPCAIAKHSQVLGTRTGPSLRGRYSADHSPQFLARLLRAGLPQWHCDRGMFQSLIPVSSGPRTQFYFLGWEDAPTPGDGHRRKNRTLP